MAITLALITVACSKEIINEEEINIEQAAEENHYTFIDALGVEVVLEKNLKE
ncbi:MAG: hypothetical protein GX339_01920 [Tissierellia bacterium]|nr:hypothetical protein [Tissierellia bacterium]